MSMHENKKDNWMVYVTFSLCILFDLLIEILIVFVYK